MIIFYRELGGLNIQVVEILRNQLQETIGRKCLHKELSVMTGIKLKLSFNVFFESVIFCKTIGAGNPRSRFPAVFKYRYGNDLEVLDLGAKRFYSLIMVLYIQSVVNLGSPLLRSMKASRPRSSFP
jgi:hypothetical protein